MRSLLWIMILCGACAAPVLRANPICCYNCHTTGPSPQSVSKLEFRQQVPAWADMMAKVRRHPGELATGGGTSAKFVGAVEGTWDDVDGYITIPYRVAGLGELDILLRGFPALPTASEATYATPRWDRRLYWLEMDGQPPRLLQALELDDDYVPEAGDGYFDAVDNGPGTVTGDCTTGAGCTLNFIPYFRYREAGVDYSDPQFPRDDFLPGNTAGFIEVGMSFVTDAQGDAIDARVLFSDGRREPFFVGDSIQLATLAYKMDEPEYIYALGYAPFVVLDDSAVIVRRAYIPGEDFSDAALPPDLDAGDRPVRLVLDASTAQGDGYSAGGARAQDAFAYGGPFDLGFTWRRAPTHVIGDSFERPRAVPQAAAKLGRTSWIRAQRPHAAERGQSSSELAALP
ncbi:hypothetical protein [Pseudomarimonas salicorniae]|uniref:Uncharacterized protein n=1 Tax=Pseudomarimonas salicorniae TaxID=2933270 RepID=A0ABT0GIM5_9GAMM|nr:hypothetical protein [Lysobacter sp. CAU 1642]MCK7594398.1 hypothetical protein [Lysobacter sp. CAU 1642]